MPAPTPDEIARIVDGLLGVHAVVDDDAGTPEFVPADAPSSDMKAFVDAQGKSPTEKPAVVKAALAEAARAGRGEGKRKSAAALAASALASQKPSS